MPLTSKITNYNPEWPLQYVAEANKLETIFSDSLIELHHIGSTAVPGLSAKPEIDMLVVVTDIKAVDNWTIELCHFDYKRGKDLSDGHLFYKRDMAGLRTHKIHTCREGHKQIQHMLRFRDYLRSHKDTLAEYRELKLRLECTNTKGISEYIAGKERFVKDVLAANS